MDDSEDTYYGEDFSDDDWEDTYNGEEGIDRKSWHFKMNKKKYEEVYKSD